MSLAILFGQAWIIWENRESEVHTWIMKKLDFLPPWPWFNAYCGDVSILGDKKPQLYYRDVIWENSELEMLVHAPIPEGRKEIVSYLGLARRIEKLELGRQRRQTVAGFSIFQL